MTRRGRPHARLYPPEEQLELELAELEPVSGRKPDPPDPPESIAA